MKLYQIIAPVVAICCAALVSCDSSSKGIGATYEELNTVLVGITDTASADAAADKVAACMKTIGEATKEAAKDPANAVEFAKQSAEGGVKVQKEMLRITQNQVYNSTKLAAALAEGAKAAL